VTRGVAARFAGIERSATYAVLEQVHALRAEGVSVVDMGGGEPDFATPEHIVDAADGALREGFTHYTPSRGVPALLAAVAEKLAKDNDVHVDPSSDLIVTPSAKNALFSALVTLLDPGDEILLPSPGWVSYASMARIVGATPVPVELSGRDGFRITRQLLERRVTPRTKVLLVNTPNNPTGRVLDAEETETVAAFAADHDLFVVSDEIYEKIRYDGVPHRSPAAVPGAAERTLTVNGFSKAYAMTGWRLGYVAGPSRVIGEMLKVQQHSVGCAGSFVQRGGLAALTGTQDPIDAMGEEYRLRGERIVQGLNALPGVECPRPQGGFYVFPDITGTGFPTSADFARQLLADAAVAVMPGSAFGPGGEGHVRLSFATSRELIDTAVQRMATALAGWRGR
jgi:aspartate aminotransferase